MKTILKKTTVAVSIAILIWMSISWLEICFKNTGRNPEYSSHNFWVKTVELYETKGWSK